MFKKIKNIIIENFLHHDRNFQQSKEIEWAHVYHDSIRGKEWLEKLPLNIGRWAGNYTFFYILNRILNDFKPTSILEFGLGESSKFVSSYIENELQNTTHLIIEQNKDFYKDFLKRHQLPSQSKVSICPLYQKNVFNHKVNSYKGLKEIVKQKFDLYIVDGPFGSAHYSRYDIVELASEFSENDEFIIIIDDYNRIGEKETVKLLIQLFKEKNIPIYWNEYSGNKSVAILGTEKYKIIKSL